MADDRKQAYRDKAEANLREWSAKVDQLLAKADKARAEGRIELYDRLENLRDRREVARQRLAKLKSSGADAWEQVKDGMSQALHDLEEAATTLQRRFREEERLDRVRRG